MSAPPLTYSFQPDEKIRDEFLRILREISVRGQNLTQRSREPMGELIHEGRLLIKRVRALLWFARPTLGLAAYARARTRLRWAAGLMSNQRDLTVIKATLEGLTRKAAKTRDRAALARILRSLVGNPAADGVAKKALRHTLQKAMVILRQSVAELTRSATRRRAWPSPSARLRKAFRVTSKAGKKAKHTENAVDFHTWRKKAKRLLYQLELTQAGTGQRTAKGMKRVAKLQDKLGEYHDDVVVEERVHRIQPLTPSAQRVLRLLAKRKACLREKAGKIARSSVAAVDDRRWEKKIGDYPRRPSTAATSIRFGPSS